MKQDFTKNFIKGKIGEIIFDEMFREKGNFTVIPFGYDRMLPEFAQYAKEAKFQKVIDNIRSAPDFALVSKDKKEVFLVEVKYRSNINIEELKKISEKIQERWHLAWIFVCTPNGFYFNRTNIIINEKKLIPLSEKWIPRKIQEKYLKLLNDFIS
jgi:Holliday junction resolvase-like predicted endonuclease